MEGSFETYLNVEESMMNAGLATFEEEFETVGSVWEAIQSNLRLSEQLERKGFSALAGDHVRSAWNEYVRFGDILCAYTGSDDLRDRLIAAMLRTGSFDLIDAAGDHIHQPSGLAAALAA